jgi:hypothetical protein|eukprot:COSAG02_NODE_616_length_19505_cov_5.004998_2_plen_64_part_00
MSGVTCASVGFMIVVCLCYFMFGCAAAAGLFRTMAKQQEQSVSRPVLRVSGEHSQPTGQTIRV